MTDASLITVPKKKRYPNGIIQAYSKRRGGMRWGWDTVIGNRRQRVLRFHRREDAESELAIARAKADCEAHGLSTDDLDLTQPLWEKFEALMELKIGAVGATAELLVCADLLRRGFEVYRAVASNSECDLIVMRYREMFRIEVKSAVIDARGYVKYKRHRFNPLAHDVLALCFLRECKIEYIPPLEEWKTRRF